MILRIHGITVELSFPLIAVMTAVILFDSSLSVTVCFIAVILHESGHLLALRHYGSIPKHFSITLFDIAIKDKSKDHRTAGKELVIVLSGIISNLVFALISYLLYRSTGNLFFEKELYANLTLAIFNALPIDSLDGGQALFILLCKAADPDRALLILDIISIIFLIPTACLGFIVLLQSKYNFTLLLTALYLFCSILMRHSKTDFRVHS